MPTLKDKIIADMQSALKQKNKNALKILRMLLAAIKQKEIDTRSLLNDDDILTILQKMVKQSKDAHNQFAAAGRSDLAKQELNESNILKTYLPKQMLIDEINAVIGSVLKDFEQATIKDMGRIMAILKNKLANKADMGLVSQLLKALLQSKN